MIMTNTNDNVTRVFHAFEENPAAMNDLLKGDEKEVIRSVLNDESLSDEDLQEVVREVNDNNVMKLYLCADGQIDGAQLLEQTGGFTSVERGKKTDAIGALLDGKLDIKDLLALITLMSGNQSSQASSQTSSSLLSTLLGGSQQQTQPASPASLFSQLLGAQPAQQQQTQQPQGGLFSQLLSGQQSQSSSSQMQNSAVLNQPLFTEAPSANSSASSAANNNQALNQFLGSSPTNSNGTVNVGSMFDLINILMGAKK